MVVEIVHFWYVVVCWVKDASIQRRPSALGPSWYLPTFQLYLDTLDYVLRKLDLRFRTDEGLVALRLCDKLTLYLLLSLISLHSSGVLVELSIKRCTDEDLFTVIVQLLDIISINISPSCF